mmetsp:Transcript_3421/g.10798  ORF Transcript_3421/g.10798 Transcript_3421/m.10798 type:complete len:299 (+) Transcript_3421:738-1634(+)
MPAGATVPAAIAPSVIMTVAVTTAVTVTVVVAAAVTTTATTTTTVATTVAIAAAVSTTTTTTTVAIATTTTVTVATTTTTTIATAATAIAAASTIPQATAATIATVAATTETTTAAVPTTAVARRKIGFVGITRLGALGQVSTRITKTTTKPSRNPAPHSAPSLHVHDHTTPVNHTPICPFECGLHIRFTLKLHESVAARLALRVHHQAHHLDRAILLHLPLQLALCRVVAQTPHEQGGIRILRRIRVRVRVPLFLRLFVALVVGFHLFFADALPALLGSLKHVTRRRRSGLELGNVR